MVTATAHASRFCIAVENALDFTKEEFVGEMTRLLPAIYLDFNDPEIADSRLGEEEYFSSYVDEDYYESRRCALESIFGPDDVFLETFEEDMKYSDTPIGASISESLADIFQPLYNFISIVKDTEGEKSLEAYLACRDDFDAYWSQTLCNVMRALNALRPH